MNESVKSSVAKRPHEDAVVILEFHQLGHY